MEVYKPVSDNALEGAVKKRTQLKNELGGVTAFTKRKGIRPAAPRKVLLFAGQAATR
jgi:hypothetical protein